MEGTVMSNQDAELLNVGARRASLGPDDVGVRGKDPEVPDSDADTFTREEGEAFRRDSRGRRIAPRALDVDQGGLGDCWLLAAMAAVAHRDPEHIENRIQARTDGNFDVRVGNETIRVQPTFPDAGYADPTPNRQSDTLWVALLEKAFAHREGGYDDLEGGNPGEAMQLLTGRRSTRTSIRSSTDPDDLFDILERGKDRDHPMTYSTKDDNVDAPLSGDHAYAILDVFERNGSKFARLYNPWGTNDNSRSRADLEIEVTMQELIDNGSRVFVNGG